MSNEDESTQEETRAKGSRLERKTKIIIVLILINITLLLGGWFYLKTNNSRVLEANNALEMVNKIKMEQERCINFLTSESGDFSKFEYCKSFLKKFPPEK